MYLWVLNVTARIRNSAAGLGADGSGFSHSKKSSGGQGRAGAVTGEGPVSPSPLLDACSALWSL